MKQQIDWNWANIEDVVKGIGNNDTEAYEEFFNRTVSKAYIIAHKVLGEKGNSADAEDIIQDAYMSVFNNIESLNDPNKAMSWFGAIVGNKCRDYLKKKRPVLFEEMDTDDVLFEDTIENEYQEFIPEEAIDYSETKRLMNEILDTLPKDQKLCTLLFYYNELSVKEIAEALECSEGTVKSRLNYSRKKIEDEVKALERKGTKLYSVAPMPFIGWMLKDAESTLIVPEVLKVQVLSSAHIGVNVTATTNGSIVKTVASGATTTGKTITTKVIAGVVAAMLAIVGGIFAGKAINEQKLRDKEDKIISQLDYEYLEALLCYLPIYDENHPVSDDTMKHIISSALYQEFLLDSPLALIKDEDIIEDVWPDNEEEGLKNFEETGFYNYIKIKGDTFDELVRIISYNKAIDETFITGLDAPETYKWHNGTILCQNLGIGGPVPDFSVEIIDLRRVDGTIEIDYELIFTDPLNIISSEKYNTSKRTAHFELIEEKYVITSIIEVAGSGFGCSISEVEY